MPTGKELKIAVVDDIEGDRLLIADMTRDILINAKVPHTISGYADGKSLLDDLRSGKKYNLLLLDILMDEMDGMSLAKTLRDHGNDSMIIFISISQELCRRGYHVDASRYLVKPLDKEELKEALMCCCDKLTKKKSCCQPIRVSTGLLFPIFNMWKPMIGVHASYFPMKQWKPDLNSARRRECCPNPCSFCATGRTSLTCCLPSISVSMNSR